MSFFNEVKEAAAKGNTGKFGLIEEKLGKQDFKEFLATLDDHSISATAIAKVLKIRGILISENSLRVYRRSRDPK